jgi:hypothetical protein
MTGQTAASFVIARKQARSEIVHTAGCAFAAWCVADRCECAKSIRTVIPVLRADDQALGYVEAVTGVGGMSTLTAYSGSTREPAVRLGEHDTIEAAAHAVYDDAVAQAEQEAAWRRHSVEYARTTRAVAVPLFGVTALTLPNQTATGPLALHLTVD